MDWRSGWRRRCWFALCCSHLATASASHKLAGNAPRSRIAHRNDLGASDRRAWKVATWPRRLCAKASFQVGSNAALQPPCGSRGIGNGPRCSRCKPDRTPRVRWAGVALPAPESSHCADVVGRPCQSKLFRLARSAALRPSRGSHDAGSPRRRRRRKPDRTPRPCWPAAGACVRLAHGTRAWASWASWASWSAFSRRRKAAPPCFRWLRCKS